MFCERVFGVYEVDKVFRGCWMRFVEACEFGFKWFGEFFERWKRVRILFQAVFEVPKELVEGLEFVLVLFVVDYKVCGFFDLCMDFCFFGGFDGAFGDKVDVEFGEAR